MATLHVMRYEADGSGRGQPRFAPVPSSLISTVQGEWQLWAAYQGLRTAIENDDGARDLIFSDAVGNPIEGNAPWILSMMAARFINDYLAAIEGPLVIFQDNVFDRLWSEFEHTIETGSYHVTWWAPIYNAQWLGEPFAIPIKPNSTLVEPAPEVMVQLVVHRRLMAMIDAQAWLQVGDRMPLKSPVLSEAPARFARRVASAIRLVAGGHGFARDITMLPAPGTPGVYGQFGGWWGLPPAWWGGVASVLSLDIQQPLQKRLSQLEKLGEPFDVVIDRYESGVTKTEPDERLIDATIGLETLLVGGSRSSTEVTFRFALSGAWLLAGVAADRPEMYRLLTELYGRRSDIVHGNLGRKRDLPPNPQEIAVDLLRKLLLQVLDRGWTWDEWIQFRRRLILGLEPIQSAAAATELPDS